MKFAFFTHVPWPKGTDQQQIIAETTEQVQYAEELGFQGAWLAEHHFMRYSMVFSSLVLATYIAARTKKIRVGTCQRFVTMSREAGFHRPMSEIPFFRYFYVAETALTSGVWSIRRCCALWSCSPKR